MPKSHSTSSQKPAKPKKPYPEFPLYAHTTGRWAKRIRGKIHYFGPWDDPEAALDNYESQKDALHSGRNPKPPSEAITCKNVANAFLNDKKLAVEAGELTGHAWRDYETGCIEMLACFGKNRVVDDLAPSDFTKLRYQMTKKWGVYRLAKMIQCIRSTFKHAYDSDLIDKPIKFGPNFSRPTKKTIRIHRNSSASKLFSAEEIRQILAIATPTMRAMILLGINAGLGNSDCGHLTFEHLDLKSGWVNYPRPKTGVARRFPLWPETAEAIIDYLKTRKSPQKPEDEKLVFLTLFGQPWFKETSDNPISNELGKILKTLNIQRKGCNFYSLRHTFRTVADEVKDQPAINHIMGHEPDDMATLYRETISNERLQAVTDYVRDWLFDRKAVPND